MPTSVLRPTTRRWLVLAVVLLADVLDLIDATLTNLAAPTITSALHGQPWLVPWLGTSYALALGSLLVLGGRVGDRYGRRRTFLAGLAGFTLASLACGLAWTPLVLIAARLVQGTFGALLIPQGFGLLTDAFPRDQLGKAFSFFGPVLGLSAVGGPILAGYLLHVDLFGWGWRAMFLINIGLGAFGLIAAIILLPSSPADPTVRVDTVGAALLAGAMLGLLGGLIAGGTGRWSLPIVLVMLAGLALLAAFIYRQRHTADPLITPSLFNNRGFVAGLLLGVVYFAVVAGLLYLAALYLQLDRGYTPIDTSLSLAPLAAGIVIASMAAFRLISQLGRRLAVIGLILTSVGSAILLTAVGLHGSGFSPTLIAGLFVVGLGMGSCFGTIFDIALGDIDPHQTGSASGSLNAVQQLANAAGSAILATVFLTAAAAHGYTAAMNVGLAIVLVSTLLCVGLSRLLPARAAQENHG